MSQIVTEAEANELLQEGKVIGANVTWRVDGNVSRLEATVLCIESERTLSLRGFYGRKNRSFVSLYRNTPIRKYTVHSSHKDPVTRLVVRQPHKHWWDDEWEDRRVYIPNDIRVGNLNEEFLDFLQECNIELRGSYAQLLLS